MERADVLDVQARTSRHSARAGSWNPERDSESLSNEEASNAQAGRDARSQVGALPNDRLVVHVEDSRSRVASKPGNLASARGHGSARRSGCCPLGAVVADEPCVCEAVES